MELTLIEPYLGLLTTGGEDEIGRVQADWSSFVGASLEESVPLPTHVDDLRTLVKVWSASDFVAQNCIAYPGLFHDLLISGDMQIDYLSDSHERLLRKHCQPVRNEAHLSEVVRYFRRREMVRIAWRDLSGWASLTETLRDLSALADSCLHVSLELLHQWLSKALGTPVGEDSHKPQSLVVLGMGKLGARELNFSSDIDLIFLFPQAGQTRGGKGRRLSNEEYFIRLGQQLIEVIDSHTQDGFVFRVDMRLRPYGESGPLVMSFNAAEEYYQSQGREWERYAMIKAREVAGDLPSGHQFIRDLRPFVYRRYLDFDAFDSLREMKGMIQREVTRKGMEDNVKLGSGGIREIEFLGQSFQLIRGGREPALRQRGIVPILNCLGSLGYLPDDVVSDLQMAYDYLRRVENRIQAMNDEQAHDLPSTQAAQWRLAFSMGYKDWDVFKQDLDRQREVVRLHFAQVFAPPQAEQEKQDVDQCLGSIWIEGLDEPEVSVLLEQAGFNESDTAWHHIKAIRDGRMAQGLGIKGRKRLQQLMPLLLNSLARREAPDETLRRLLDFIEAIMRRTAYLALLVENPDALAQLVTLCEASPWIAELITDHPILMDELLDARTLYMPLAKLELATQLQAQLNKYDAGDLEAEMDVLRYFKKAQVLRVAAVDVMGALPLMVISDHLTEIAEVILDQVLMIARRDMASRANKKGLSNIPPFAVVAYGKMGGVELGYSSDLDVVFLHGHPEKENDALGVYFTRLGQRIIHMLNTQTAAGQLYEVDTRLRPSGASGLLVSDIEAFADYQREDAWVWEHQALVRARVVSGDTQIAAAFNAIRCEVLSQRRDESELKEAVRSMRERMRGELAKQKSGCFDIKQDEGGIADIEFLVQYMVLRWACDYPTLLDWTDNIRLIETASKVGLMSDDDASLLCEAYRAYRSAAHGLALQERSAMIEAEPYARFRAAVSTIWQAWLA